MIYFLTFVLLLYAKSCWAEARNARDTIRRVWAGKYESLLVFVVEFCNVVPAMYSLAAIYLMWRVHLQFDLDALVTQAFTPGV